MQVPVAVVGLIDAEHLQLVAASGVPASPARRLHSFCDASLKARNPTCMVVEDTLLDAR